MARCIAHALGAPLLIALICSPCMAQAQVGSASVPTAEVGGEAPGPEVDAPTEARPWYGWQNLLFDVVGGTLIAGGLGAAMANDSGDWKVGPFIVALMGFGAFGLGSPIVHFAHENLWGIGSLATRVAVLSLAATGAARSCDEGPCTNAIPLGVASVVLGVGIIVVDAVLAREPRKAPPVTVAPWANPHARAGGLSVSSSW